MVYFAEKEIFMVNEAKRLREKFYTYKRIVTISCGIELLKAILRNLRLLLVDAYV